jgi:hypothetical protein
MLCKKMHPQGEALSLRRPEEKYLRIWRCRFVSFTNDTVKCAGENEVSMVGAITSQSYPLPTGSACRSHDRCIACNAE